MKKLLLYVVGAVAIVVVIAGLALNSAKNLVQPPAAPFGGPTATLIVKSGPTVIEAIRLQAKLETVVMNVVKDMTVRRTHGLFGACSEEITYLGYFNVTAGIDLAKVTPANISVTNDGIPEQASVVITLPPPELLHNELDTENSRIVAQSTSKWIPGCSHQVADMTVEAQQMIRTEAERAARRKGILGMAEEKAAFELKRLLLDAGYRNVTIRYADKNATPEPTFTPRPIS